MTDSKIEHLTTVLSQLLDSDTDITARAVVRASSQFRFPTDITRPQHRRALLEEFKDRQEKLRRMAIDIDKFSKPKLALRLLKAEAGRSQYQAQLELVAVAVRGLIKAVGVKQGLDGWIALFPDYERIKRELIEMGAMPTAEITKLREEP